MDDIYEPTMSKRDFMLASLKANAKLQPRDVESFWKKKKAVESVDKDVRRKPPSKYYDELTKEQLDALFDGYYTQLRGSVGARGFWEWFNRNNDQQKESIENKGKPSGKTREVTYKDGSTGVYEYKVQPFVSWRELRAFVSNQESNQLSRPANKKTQSLASTFTNEQLKPFVRFQIDSIIMQKGGVNKAEDKYGDYGMKVVFNMIDLYSGYTWQGAAKSDTGENAAAFVERVIDSIEERWDITLPPTVIRSDNGAAYSKEEFERRLKVLNKPITFEKAPSSTPNAMAYIEGSNKNWRNIARRLTRVEKGRYSESKPYASRWYGKNGSTFREINSLMNTRPDGSRGYESPASILEAAITGDNPKLITKVNAAIAKAANMRRGPSTEKPLRKNDRVRLINAAYLKSTMRSNAQKQNPRWSEDIYRIIDKRGTVGTPLKYRVSPEDSNVKHDDTVWYGHDKLQKIVKAVTPNPDVLEKPRTYKLDKSVGDSVYYDTFPFPELAEDLQYTFPT